MKTFPFIVIFIFFVFSSCAGIRTKGLYQDLPSRVGKWKAHDKDELYNRDTLYQYINGGAELYLAFDFQQVFVRRYIGSDNDEIILDIYDMGNAGDAFGIFSVERADAEIGIGQESEYGGGLLRFWKDRFFVSIITTGDEKNAQPTMIELAQAVDCIIDTKGLKPALLKVLPREALDETSLRFFHTAAILNRQYFLAEKNILKLDKHSDCVLAKYKGNDNSAYVLLVQYQNNELARDAYRTFLSAYMPEAKESGIVQVENKTWTMTKTEGSILIIVMEANQKDFGMNLMAQIKP
jgi:hypothetical protein